MKSRRTAAGSPPSVQGSSVGSAAASLTPGGRLALLLLGALLAGLAVVVRLESGGPTSADGRLPASSHPQEATPCSDTAAFWDLVTRSKRRVEAGDLDGAARDARALLRDAENYTTSRNYGNAIHYGHMVLGVVAVARGDIDQAKAELIGAATTPGSPQLASFGPNMSLAAALLRVGARDAVVQYLKQCLRFWELGGDQLARWIAEVEEGRTPDFGPNLKY